MAVTALCFAFSNLSSGIDIEPVEVFQSSPRALFCVCQAVNFLSLTASCNHRISQGLVSVLTSCAAVDFHAGMIVAPDAPMKVP
ncbi:hypothetical protein PF010_g14595 [Phytophthora fragariae]|uniref:Uncharacterized protein n=1 Tax=Phytophthora fragariae TaxID=53985 RepID=A0A6G0NQR3_9STRA|nr:hypothetical protein PF010_g14595 [Phytophthora fragariae]KAE9218289.1 hypothetical protein PF004_g13906 [Phytophthora fragariae]